jgi:hypothetical protein
MEASQPESVQAPAEPTPPEQPAAPPEPVAEEAPPDRDPAAEQSPVATEAQNRIIGDPGFRDEQATIQGEGGSANVDTPVRTSAPPAELQSGMPLPEDRAAAAAAPPQAEGPAPAN